MLGIKNLVPRMEAITRFHLRKGAPSSGNGPGQDLQFFRFDSEDEELTEEFKELFGKTPGRKKENAIPIRLPFPTMDQNFITLAMEEWLSGGRLLRRCDSENIMLYIDEETGHYSTTPRPCLRPEGRCACKPTTRLRVVVPDLTYPCIGVLHSTSWDAQNIHDAVLTAHEVTDGKYGEPRLNEVPFLLWREPKDVTYADNGGRSSHKSWLIHMSIEEEWLKENVKQLFAPKEERLLEGGDLRRLVDQETGEIVEVEARLIEQKGE